MLSRNRKTFAVSSLVLNLFASQIGELFLPHLYDTGHSFGPVERIMDNLNIWSRKENLEKFHSYSDTIRNMQINEESTTGYDIYDVATQNERFLYWPIICKLNSKKGFIKVYAT